MSTQIRAAVSAVHQKGQDLKRELRIRFAFVGIVGPFPSRPAPRAVWDDAARGSNFYRPWGPMQKAVRNACRKACGLAAPQRETVEARVVEFYGTLEADALCEFPAPEHEPPRHVLHYEETKAQAAADVAQQRLLWDDSDEAKAEAERTARLHERALNRYRRAVERERRTSATLPPAA